MDQSRPSALCRPLSKHRPDTGAANHPPLKEECLSPGRGKAEVERLYNYDPSTGEFRWRSLDGNGRKRWIAGHINAGSGYRTIRLLGKNFRAHRIAWLVFYGEWPNGEIDHINGDRLDNRMQNLRVVDRLTNAQNRQRAHKSNRSGGLIGASRIGSGRYQARIRVDGGVKFLGVFDTPEEAHAAYVAAKRRLHAGCTI